MKGHSNTSVEWRQSGGLTDYRDAVATMESRAEAVRRGTAQELIWLLEHPPLYTAGTSAASGELLAPDALPVYRTGRGGRYTYHGPGQRVAYVILDLERRGRDIRCFVHDLEEWVIQTLARFGIRGERRAGRVGIWVARGGGREDKIAAIGVRIRRWVSYHGIAINLDPDLSHFDGIVPCGIAEPGLGVTSLRALGSTAGMTELDAALREAFEAVFGAQGSGRCAARQQMA